jgi:hypothetical protein
MTQPTPWYDYKNQAWVFDGVYDHCFHPTTMDCGCYSRLHAGEKPTQEIVAEYGTFDPTIPQVTP